MKIVPYFAACLAGMALSSAALGCSCEGTVRAGFIHADVKHLPSNARGALFLPPLGDLKFIGQPAEGILLYSGDLPTLSPSAFTIKADQGTAPLPAQITRLNLAADDAQKVVGDREYRFARKADLARYQNQSRPIDWKKMIKAGTLVDSSAAIAAATALVRVGPVGGFKPGVRYTIEYTGETTSWAYPAYVEHTLDGAPVATGELQYALVLDGPPKRRLLAVATGGSCSSYAPATVQDFHYAVPDSHKPYLDATLYFSEFRDERAGARFADLVYLSNNCSGPRYGASARDKGMELISAACGPDGGRASVRGWAGLLEVEDRLRPTDIVEVDFGKASGASCSGFGMLKEAMASQDALRVEEAVCGVSTGQAGELDPGDLPSMTALLSLATSGSERARSCSYGALSSLFIGAPVHSGAFLGDFGRLLAPGMVSADKLVAQDSATILFNLLRYLADADAREPDVAPSTQKLLGPVFRVLLKELLSGSAEQSQIAGEIIGGLENEAMTLVPQLLAAAGSRDASAANAAHALAGIVPDDPKLHQILLRNAADPALLTQSALDYNRVAATVDRAKAIALLTEAARQGSPAAIDQLAAHGPAARSSAPVLIALMEGDGLDRSRALSALLKVSDGGPEVLAAFARVIDTVPDMEMYDFLVADFAELGKKGRALLPAIESRMRRPMSQDRQSGLKTVIESMKLPKAQARAVLARLAKVTLAAED